MIAGLVLKRLQHIAFGHFGAHDIRRFMRPWANDAIFIYPGTSSLAGSFQGREAIAAWFQRYMDHFPRIEFTVRGVCVDNPFGLISNLMTSEWTVAVTNRSGEDYQYDGVTVARTRMAKVVHVRDYIFDPSILQRALGEEARRDPPGSRSS